MDSSSAMSSGVSFTAKAPMFWLRLVILVVPGMGHTSFPWWWTHAKESWEGVHPFIVAKFFTRSNKFLLCSRFSGWNLGRICRRWNIVLKLDQQIKCKNTVHKGIGVWRIIYVLRSSGNMKEVDGHNIVEPSLSLSLTHTSTLLCSNMNILDLECTVLIRHGFIPSTTSKEARLQDDIILFNQQIHLIIPKSKS